MVQVKSYSEISETRSEMNDTKMEVEPRIPIYKLLISNER